MDIVERLRQTESGMVYLTYPTMPVPHKLAHEAADEIERLRGVLQQIADIEHEDIPSPKTPTEGIMWTVLAMAVGLAEDALKDAE